MRQCSLRTKSVNKNRKDKIIEKAKIEIRKYLSFSLVVKTTENSSKLYCDFRLTDTYYLSMI